MRRIRSTARVEAGDREELATTVQSSNVRMRASRAQFAAELLAFAGDSEGTLGQIEVSVAAGLQDAIWMQRCPLLDPLRDHPRFRELAGVVVERAAEVVKVVRDIRRTDVRA